MTLASRVAGLSLVGLLVPGVLPANAPTAPVDELAACDHEVRERPDDYFAWRCFERLGRDDESAVRRLEARLRVAPHDAWMRLSLGMALLHADPERTERLLARAAEDFADAGDLVGEAQARFNLGRFCRRRYRLEEGVTELEQSAELATAAGATSLATLARIEDYHVWVMQGRYDEAWVALRRMERAGLAGLDGLDRRIVYSFYSALANTAINLNLDEEALAYWGIGSRYAADALSRLLNENGQLTILARMAAEGRIDGERVESRAREMLEMAERSGAPSIATTARCLLAAHAPFEEAFDFLESCWETAKEHHCQRYEFEALLELAERAADLETPEARAALDRATALYDRSILRDPRDFRPPWIRSLLAALRLRVGPRDEAIAEADAALREIERLRSEQRVELLRASTFSAYASFYHRYAVFLLGDPDATPTLDTIEDAFAVVERMRARLLLDRLAAAELLPEEAPDDPAVLRRAAMLTEIATVQKRLSTESDDSDRQRDLEELERLELEEAELRARILAEQPLPEAIRARWDAPLAEVRRALDEDEMLISFQVPNRRGMTAWALAVTRGEVRTYVLPAARELDPMVRVFAGTLHDEHGTGARAGVRLFSDLLRPAIEPSGGLPRRLVIVAEGPLADLPFDALRAEPDDAPVGAVVETVIVPSATTWLHWRKARSDIPAGPVLVLADPTLPSPAESASLERGSVVREAVRLGPLPWARVEARRIVRRAGRASELLMGDAATEAAFKQAPLERFGVIHLAAHALVDQRSPERSAVVLAAAGEEDGLLQMREIVDLPLDHGVVVLSACRSAAGPQIEGEGVMSLARAFFAAGASTVVGSLWPLRDDQAEPLFREFYEGLARGETVSAAMAGARRARMRAGAPTASWAGIVVLGEGGVAPLLASGPRSRLPELVAAAAAAAVALLLLWNRLR